MSELSVRPIDPRDQRWEVSVPTFRVNFWRRSGETWSSREFELTGGDVDLVSEWARERTNSGEAFVLYCCVESADGLGLVRLLGHEPASA
jgi:hypothetical protein